MTIKKAVQKEKASAIERMAAEIISTAREDGIDCKVVQGAAGRSVRWSVEVDGVSVDDVPSSAVLLVLRSMWQTALGNRKVTEGRRLIRDIRFMVPKILERVESAAGRGVRTNVNVIVIKGERHMDARWGIEQFDHRFNHTTPSAFTSDVADKILFGALEIHGARDRMRKHRIFNFLFHPERNRDTSWHEPPEIVKADAARVLEKRISELEKSLCE